MAARKVTIPAWADELIDRVCTAHGVTRPHVDWKRTPPTDTTVGYTKTDRYGFREKRIYGHTYHDDYARGLYYGASDRHPNGRLMVECRHDDHPEARRVLLHELAHHIAGRSESHSPKFYVVCFRLYECYGGDALSLAYGYDIERDYKPVNARLGMRDYLDGGWAEVKAA